MQRRVNGVALRTIRELAGISQTELARRADIGQATLSNIEKGKHGVSPQLTRKLADSGKLAQQLLDLDVEEMKDHQRVWKARGGILKRLESVNSEVVGEINDIVDGMTDD